MIARLAFFSLGILSLTAMIGCGAGYSGPPLAPAKGKVVMDSKPVEGAMVTFISEDGSVTASGVTNASGEYEISVSQGGKSYPGAPVGKNKVTVSKQVSTMSGNASMDQGSADPTADFDGDVAGGAFDNMKMDGAGNFNTVKSEIPFIYSRVDQSGLTATVEAGKDNMVPDFVLDSKAGEGTSSGQGQGQGQ